MSVNGSRSLRAARVALVAVRDVAWLLFLLPLGMLFHLLVLLARAYYACHRRKQVCIMLHGVGLLGTTGWMA